jgi:UDP:flavonoid glycosyltransferase YjiC (YdhE family)
MKVLLAPFGSRGDVQPQLLLGEELMRRGHRVSVAAPPNFAGSVEQHGFGFVPLGQDINEFMLGNSAMTEQHPARALPRQIALLRRHLERQVADMFSVQHDADLVVSAGLSFAGKMVADALAVPHVFCHYTLSGVYSAEYPPAVAPVFGLPRLANRALWATVTQAFDLALGGSLNRLRQARGLAQDRKAWRAIHATETLLAQDALIGQLSVDSPGHNLQVPAFVPRPADAAPLSDLLERFLRGAGDGLGPPSPVVYIGFGSMPTVDRARILQIAVELFEQHGARVILFSSHAEDDGVELPAGVFSIDDADHATLFPRVDLLVHHGGAGTTAAALRAGVPQLIVPHIVDQFFHGRRIAELGLGPAPVTKAALSADVIARALKDRFQYWAKTQAARASVSAEGGVRQAADHLEHLVHTPQPSPRRPFAIKK